MITTHTLGLTLLHSLWQGAIITLITAQLLEFVHASNWRYRIALSGLWCVPVSFILTLGVFTPVPDRALTLGSLSRASLPVVEGWYVSLSYLTYLWLTGVMVYALLWLGGMRRVQHLKQSGVPALHATHAHLETQKQRLHLKQPVTLHESVSVNVPTVIGWLRPIILLPVAYSSNLTTQQLEAILLHELAHIQRNDYLINQLQILTETLFFYHPAVWWLTQQARTERENCCDDTVIHVTHDPEGYARTLATLELLRHDERCRVVAPLAASGGQLMNRIRRLTGQSGRSATVYSGVYVFALLMLGVLAACTTFTGKNVQVSGDYATVCLSANVNTGHYEMPAFNTASVRAMTQALQGSAFVSQVACDARTLNLRYVMRFDAQTLTWQATLEALTPQGELAWYGAKHADVVTEGAYQYTTESTAQALVHAFLTAR